MKVCSICGRGIVGNWWCPVHPFAPQEIVPVVSPIGSGKQIVVHTAVRLREAFQTLSGETCSSEAEEFFWRGVNALRNELENSK